jgi:cytochrome c
MMGNSRTDRDKEKLMYRRYSFRTAVLVCLAVLLNQPARADGDPLEGARLFRACLACHSVKPGRHMTGPSLAEIWEQKAGSIEGFPRYSDALKKADITWNEQTLDAWLKNPREFAPGNRMVFRGIADATKRQDLIAYLRQLSQIGSAATAEQPGASAGRERPMGGMNREPEPLRLRELGPNSQIASITYCGDTYTVKVRSGETHPFWEFNVRFKTDGSGNGPESGKPVLIPAGMKGDRVSVVFAAPIEISTFIKPSC